ncbi:MAG: ATP-binding cassette domain-containing protein, partial [Desulfocapsa sp.]|nr:ATP-binding cassette domain-containing protein [Desulfocapsa sp.]
STTLLALLDLPFIVIFIGIIYYVGGPLALIPAIAVPVVILVGLLIQIPFKRFVEDGFKEATQKNALLIEIIGGLEAIKTSQADGQIQKRWEEIIGMHARSSAKTRGLMNFSISLSMWSAQMVSVGIIIWGVYRITAGDMTMGGLIACNILAGRAMAPLGSVASMLTRLQHSRMSLKSLDLLMQVPNERSADNVPLRHEQLTGNILFEDVNFQYPQSEKPALKSINLTIHEGEKVGIIGRVGSGKSTLGRLILGLYQPQQGEVKVGGINLRQIDIADLRNKIGYVAQDNHLFYGSIRYNISIGMPYADDRSILRAATIAGVTDFIGKQPAGFGTQVGEGGKNLSGGQRQLVTIARTLLKSPDVLILDEPTNSLDSATEATFRGRLADEIKDKTLVLITHRHSMLSLVNRLIVLDNGQIVADGPKDAVLDALKNDKIRT